MLITGFAASPNGQHFAPNWESLVTEFEYSTGLTPTKFQIWVVGAGDPNLTSPNCQNYYNGSDPFNDPNRVGSLPAPMPIPTPEVFPTILPQATRGEEARVVHAVNARRGTLSTRINGRFIGSMKTRQARDEFVPIRPTSQKPSSVIRPFGTTTLTYYPQEFSTVDLVLSADVFASDCPFGDPDLNKCEPDNLDLLEPTNSALCGPNSPSCVLPGDVEVEIAMYVGDTIYLSNPIEYFVSDDPNNFEHPSNGAPNAPPGSVSTNVPGPPAIANYVSGALTHSYEDFSLGGPMGVGITRSYDSRLATFTHSAIGTGWHYSFGDYLDLSGKCASRINYINSEGRQEYFTAVTPGNASYDQQTGNTLAWNANDTYTLTTWDSQQITFGNYGQMLSRIDRFGNTQTMTYNSAGLLQKITDALGRVATVSYNAQNLISSIAIASGPKVSYGYTNGELTTVTEPDNGKWTYTYTTHNLGAYLQSIKNPNGHIVENDTFASVTLPVNGDGSQTVTSYRLATQNTGGSPVQGALKYTYSYQDQNGNSDAYDLTTVTDALNRPSYFTWDVQLQELTDISGPLCECGGSQRHYTYDQFGRMTSKSDGASATLQYQYLQDIVSSGYVGSPGNNYSQLAVPNLTTISDLGYEYGRTSNYTYGQPGSIQQDVPVSISDPSSGGGRKTTTISYGATGQPTQVQVTGQTASGTVTYTSKNTFDSRGRQLTLTLPRTDVSQVWTNKYYSDTDSDLKRRGQLNTQTDPLGHVTTYGGVSSYDYYGNPLDVADQNNVDVKYTTDGSGRILTAATQPIGAFTTTLTTTLTRDASGQITSVTGPNGNKSAYSRDSTERLTAKTNVDSSGDLHDHEAISYDLMNEPSAVALQLCAQSPVTTCSSWTTSRNIEFSYDVIGRLSQMTFGPASKPINETLLGYNDPPDNAYGMLAYVVSGTPSDLAAGNGGVVGHEYNYNNWRLLSDDFFVTSGNPQNGFNYSLQQSLSYDVLNHPANMTPDNYPSSSSTYDDWGRLTSEFSPSYGQWNYTYDPDNNLVSMRDAAGNSRTYIYDALNRPTTITSTRTGSPTETVSYTYDDTTAADLGKGRLHTVTDPSGTQTLTYERSGRVASSSETITGKGTFLTSYVYDGDGNVSSLTYPSGRVVTYTYDSFDRPVSAKTSSTVYASAAAYAPFGPRTSLTFGNGMIETTTLDGNYNPSELIITGSGGAKVVDRAYVRDGHNRITSTTDKLAAANDLTYGYTGFQINAANSGSNLWGNDGIFADQSSYNVDYQQFANYHGAPYQTGIITANNPYQPSASAMNNNQLPMTYDGNGNVTNLLGSVYTYSARNYLTAGAGLTFSYDAYGHRVYASSSAGTRGYSYSVENKLLSETTTTTGSEAYDYIYFGGDPIAEETIGSSTAWTAIDEGGTPFLQTNSADATSWYADYEPFGAVYSLRTADTHQPLRRPGQEATQISGTTGPNGDLPIYYNFGRWYVPALARYTQPDPTNPLNSSENPYAYTFLDPINSTDPNGEKVWIYTHPVPATLGVYGHAYLVLSPDEFWNFTTLRRFNPSCNVSVGFNNISAATISGEPKHYDPRNFGPLISDPKADLDNPSGKEFRELDPNCTGACDTNLINKLLQLDDSYRANSNSTYTYSVLPGPNQSTRYNSNSYIASILQQAGYPPTSFNGAWPYLPGWKELLDKSAFSGKSPGEATCDTPTSIPPELLPPGGSGPGNGGGGSGNGPGGGAPGGQPTYPAVGHF